MNQSSASIFKDFILEWLVKNTFWILVIIAILAAAVVKGIAFSGMFIGMMTTIALWALVIKLPIGIQAFMGRHIVVADFVLTLCSFLLLGYVGSGPTAFMAASTVAVLLTLLLKGLNIKYKDYDKDTQSDGSEHVT